VLAQTHADLELLLVLDGATDPVRTAAAELAAGDMRVRVHDLPKGAGHGYENRQRAIDSTAAPAIAYIGDDDLWLPHHLETLLPALEGEGPALSHSLPVYVDGAGRLRVRACDLALEWYVELHLGGENRLPPSQVVHTRDALEGTSGWAMPAAGPGDLALWQQILARPDVRRRSLHVPTALVFPSPERPGWDAERRRAELQAWTERLAQPGAGSALAVEVLAALGAQRAAEEAEAAIALSGCAADRDALAEERPRLVADRDTLAEHARAVEADREAVREMLTAQAQAATAARDEAEARLAERDRQLREAEAALARRWPARIRRLLRRQR
jgi:hypothetical protein